MQYHGLLFKVFQRTGIFLFVILMAGNVTGNDLVLNGTRDDVLVNIESGSFQVGRESFSFPVDNFETGWVVCVQRKLYVIADRSVVNLHSGAVLDIPGSTLLPDVSRPASGQWMVSGDRIFIPVLSGVQIVEPTGGEIELCPYDHILKVERDVRLNLPVIATGKAGRMYAWENGLLKTKKKNGWMQLSESVSSGVLEQAFLDSRELAWMVRFQVDQGNLESFRIAARSLDKRNDTWGDRKIQEGLLRNLFVDAGGRLVMEYMDASIMAALFQAKKIKIRTLGGPDRLDRHHSFSVSHKRRHVYAVSRSDGGMVLMIQCKDGNCYLADPVSGRFKRLDVGFGYDYTFLRGESSGIFYRADTGDQHIVDLRFPAER